MEIVLSWKLLFSTRAWHSIRFSTQAPLHALFIPVLIGLCSYKNVLAIWGHSRWKLTFTQIVSLRAFSFVLTAILNSEEGCRCTLVPGSPFPILRSQFSVPRSPFPVPDISNIHLRYLTATSAKVKLLNMNHTLRYRTIFSPVAHLYNFASSWKDMYMAYNVSKWYLLFQNETWFPYDR